jgi:zinc transporter, ZIP family
MLQLFSALYSMLPSAKAYLVSGGFEPQPASYLLIGLFLAGVIGIQLLSRIMHHFIPTHIVDCDHTHDDEEGAKSQAEMEEHHHESDPPQTNTRPRPSLKFVTDPGDEETPLLSRDASTSPPKHSHLSAPDNLPIEQAPYNGFVTAPTSRRPSMLPRTLTRTLTKLTTSKLECDETGPCKGFSDPCGQDCFKAINRRGTGLPTSAPSRQTTFPRTPTNLGGLRYAHPVPEADEEEGSITRPRARTDGEYRPAMQRSRSSTHHYHHPNNEHSDPSKHDGYCHHSSSSVHSDAKAEHHHHVPTNAFLSIGLQTSIAIALHKAPEGFITYATNHANPTLGFAVFMALFIHNISEGFAMALPLYLALQSRAKAILWSSLLGGVSQPLGAGIAAVWFKVAKGTNGVGKPGEDVYGCMFAVTAGVMASVALQLFAESLGLTHNKNICIGFAFLGMGILGISSALTA